MYRATFVLAAAAAVTACVPGLPGGSLGEPAGGATGGMPVGGSGGTAGMPSAMGSDASAGSGGGPDGGGPDASVGGAGGMGAPDPSLFCTSGSSTMLIVTDFTDAFSTDPIRFGMAPAITGRTFSTSADGGPAAQVSIVSGPDGPALQIAGPGGTQFEAGLRFDAPVDASAYNAVRFTMRLLAPCSVSFSVQSSENVTTAQDPRGTCTQAPCPAPSTNVSQSGALCVPLAGVPPGSPVDTGAIIRLSWSGAGQCAFIVDQIAFVLQ